MGAVGDGSQRAGAVQSCTVVGHAVFGDEQALGAQMQLLLTVVALAHVDEVGTNQVFGRDQHFFVSNLQHNAVQQDVAVQAVGDVHQTGSNQIVGLADGQQVDLLAKGQRSGSDAHAFKVHSLAHSTRHEQVIVLASATGAHHRHSQGAVVAQDRVIDHGVDQVHTFEVSHTALQRALLVFHHLVQTNGHSHAHLVVRHHHGGVEQFGSRSLATGQQVVGHGIGQHIGVVTLIVGFTSVSAFRHSVGHTLHTHETGFVAVVVDLLCNNGFGVGCQSKSFTSSDLGSSGEIGSTDVQGVQVALQSTHQCVGALLQLHGIGFREILNRHGHAQAAHRIGELLVMVCHGFESLQNAVSDGSRRRARACRCQFGRSNRHGSPFCQIVKKALLKSSQHYVKHQ